MSDLTRLTYDDSIQCNQCYKVHKNSHSVSGLEMLTKERDFSFVCDRCGYFNPVKGEIGLSNLDD